MKKLLIAVSLLGIVYGADARNLRSEPIKKSWLQPARIGSVGISTTLALKKYAPRQLTKEEVIENLSQGMDSYYKSWVITAVARINPLNYGLFIATVNTLSVGMNGHDKSWVICVVTKVNPSNYRLFIETVNTLSSGMTGYAKVRAIEAIAKVDPSNYILFIETVNTLSVGTNDYSKHWVIEAVYRLLFGTTNTLSSGMTDYAKSLVIEAVVKIAPSNYILFIETVNTLSVGMNGNDKSWVIEAVVKVAPSNYRLFIGTVNTLSVGMSGEDKSWLIKAVAKVDPSNYRLFIGTVNTLSVGMSGEDKSWLIKAVAKVDPSNYILFIETVNTLSSGMTGYAKVQVIEAVVKVAPSNYRLFIGTVNTLSVGMNGNDKSWVIEAVAKVDPSKWTDTFIQTVNTLSVGMSDDDKSCMIRAVAHMKLEWYDPFVRYATQHNFFRIVPSEVFYRSLVNANRLDTAEHFQAIVNRLRNEYTAQGARGAPQGVAFQIHNYRSTQVTTASGHKQRLENAVVYEINRLVQSLPTMDYDIAKGLVLSLTLEADPKKLGWALGCVEGSEDYKRVFTSVVSYLSSLGGNALNSWTEGWVKESRQAYDGRNGDSCVAGVRERVVTALRDVPEISDSLKHLFVQGDRTLIIPLKIANIGGIKWEKTLKELGANSTMTDQVAFPLFQKALRDYFELDPSTDPRIKSNIEMLESDFLDNEDGEGHWNSNLKQKLQVLERGSASPANKEDTAFSVHEGVMEP
jgi:ribosomal protein L24